MTSEGWRRGFSDKWCVKTTSLISPIARLVARHRRIDVLSRAASGS